MPDVVALAEITAVPQDVDRPALGGLFSEELLWHATHNHQVRVRLDEWWAVDE